MRKVEVSKELQLSAVVQGFWRLDSWKLQTEELVDFMKACIDRGVTSFDTAEIYADTYCETLMGQAFARDKGLRGQIQLVSKTGIFKENIGGIPFGYYNTTYERVKQSCKESLQRLHTDYLDLYLIHWPKPSPDCENWKKLDIETWKALEKLYHEKRVRAIGVSNFLPHHIENLLESCEVVPAVDQLEFHPGYTQEAAVRYCQEHDILVQAWSPLGRRRVMDDELIRALAERHHVTQAQICLRYAFQKGIIPIPKASSEERMKNNQDIFGFELTKTEMQKLDTMPPVGWSGEHPDRERVSIE